MKNITRLALMTCALGALLAGPAAAQDIIRHKIPNSNFPIAQAVEVPAGKTTVYVSGAVPNVADGTAEPNSIKAYGDTKTQTENVFKSIEETLKSLNLTNGDIIKMQVFLVGDPDKGGKMDFSGFMEAYTQFFGTNDQPNLPTRSVFQVAGLANPGFLVEIEVTAVRP